MTAVLWSALVLLLGVVAYVAASFVPRRLGCLITVLAVVAAFGIVLGQSALVISSVRALGGSQMVEIVAVCVLLVAEAVAIWFVEARR